MSGRLRVRWSRLVLAAVTFAPLAVPLEARQTEALVQPGHEALEGARLRPFEARWQERQLRDGTWVDTNQLQESLSIDAAQGTVTFRRVVDAGPWGFDVEVVMDRETLAPRSLTRTVRDGVPDAVVEQLAQAGVTRRFEYIFHDGLYEFSSTDFDGNTHTETAQLDRPVFDATAMGVILAALRLEVGFEARIPIVFVQAGNGGISHYDLIAKVVADDQLEIDGHDGVTAYKVESGWADPGTGAITSAGGADESGGAYWILPSPTDGLPYAPRYKNNAIDYILQPAKGSGSR